jgi:hypothetical protein
LIGPRSATHLKTSRSLNSQQGRVLQQDKLWNVRGWSTWATHQLLELETDLIAAYVEAQATSSRAVPRVICWGTATWIWSGPTRGGAACRFAGSTVSPSSSPSPWRDRCLARLHRASPRLVRSAPTDRERAGTSRRAAFASAARIHRRKRASASTIDTSGSNVERGSYAGMVPRCFRSTPPGLHISPRDEGDRC